MNQKSILTPKDDGKNMEMIVIDKTDKHFEHKCVEPEWKYVSSRILGNPLKTVTLWSMWRCPKCRLLKNQTQKLEGVLERSEIMQPDMA